MENLRILAKNLDQKNEIINLFILLGYKEYSFCTYNNDDLMGIHVYRDGDIQDVLDEDYNHDEHKEITLPELRALVSLHKNPINMDKVLSGVRSDALGLLKDKEYLNKETYEFVRSSSELNDMWIEIPEGSNIAVIENYNLGFYSKYTSADLDHFGRDIVWLRPAQPEELPFVDDEPNQTTINAMNEADTLFADTDSSKHNHYFIDVSDVDEVDFYEIALRYNVTDPCIQHILKKCLAVGNRGHKDFHTDLKDIYDTAARALRIHGA